MRRYISLACVALIVVMCMAVPVSATETNSGSLINVLDYSTADDSGTNSFGSGGTLVATARYEIPFRPYVRFVDIVFTSANGAPSSVYFRDSLLTLEQITGRLFRAYGYVTVTGSTFDLTFNSDTNGVTYNVVSFYVSTYASSAYDIEAYCDIGSVDYISTIHYVPDDEINYRQFLGTENYDDVYLNLYLYTDDWKKYDYIDFQLFLTCGGINSISAMMGSTNIPLEISMTSDNSYVTNDYYITIRMDLTGLDRTSNDEPMIIVEGLVAQGLVNEVNVYNVSGHVALDNVDPVSYWLYSINKTISAGFSSVSSWISAQTTAIQTQFTQLKTAISGHFTNLNSWITTQTSAIQTQFTQLKSALSTHFTNLDKWIDSQTAALEAAIRGDTSPGDEFQQEVEDKDQQLDDMAAVMDSVERPELNSVNVSADTYIDTTVLAASTQGLTTVIAAPVFLDVIIMSILMATAGYVLFGKR